MLLVNLDRPLVAVWPTVRMANGLPYREVETTRSDKMVIMDQSRVVRSFALLVALFSCCSLVKRISVLTHNYVVARKARAILLLKNMPM
jgi:hypothetical protein